MDQSQAFQDQVENQRHGALPRKAQYQGGEEGPVVNAVLRLETSLTELDMTIASLQQRIVLVLTPEDGVAPDFAETGPPISLDKMTLSQRLAVSAGRVKAITSAVNRTLTRLEL